jgi:hypothetical protein
VPKATGKVWRPLFEQCHIQVLQRYPSLVRNRFACRDPPRYLSCGLSGHISSCCRHKQRRPPLSPHLTRLTNPSSIALFHSDAQPPPLPLPLPNKPSNQQDPGEMARRLSLGEVPNGSWCWNEDQDHEHALVAYFPGHPRLRPRVVEKMTWAPSHPRLRPRVVEKMTWAPDEIQQRRQLLTHHALLIIEEGAL